MATVSAEAIRKLHEFIESLPEEARSKCSLCNQTLTHIVKQAEAQTGAGTRTVTRMLAEKINETAAHADQVTEDALRARVRETSGEKSYPVGPNRPNEPTAQYSVNNHGTRGTKLDPKAVYEEIEAKVKKGKSIKSAAEEIAQRTGKRLDTVRKAYLRERDRVVYGSEGKSTAEQLACIAISQLSRIDKSEDGWAEALEKVENWIANFKGGAQ